MPTVRILPAEVSVEVPAGTRLVDAIRAAGRPIASPCGDDLICGKCGVRVLEGRVTREARVEREAKARNRVAPSHRLACAIRVRDDLVVTADYWGTSAPARALLLIDHGSRRAEAHDHLEQLARALRARRPELRLYLAHMELAPPSIESAIERCVQDGVTRIDALPLFLAPGRHVTQDLPERIRQACAPHPEVRVRVLTALGERPELVDWILAALPTDA